MKTAVLFAAGLGTRLLPVTRLIPKCMIEINGKSIFENNVEILQKSGFSVIALVGYRSSAIPVLPGVEYRFYSQYASTNSGFTLKENIDLVKPQTLLMNADCYLLDNSFLDSIEDGKTAILCQPLKASGWSYDYDRDGRLMHIDYNSKSGFGDGIVYLGNEDDISLIKQYINEISSEDFWETLIVSLYKTINITVKRLPRFYEEFDTVSELVNSNMIESKLIAKHIFDKDGEIKQLGGLTNYNFVGEINGEQMVVRLPGKQTDKIINRDIEKQITEIAVGNGITPQTSFFCDGVKFSRFLPSFMSIPFELFKDNKTIRRLNALLLKLHCYRPADFTHLPVVSLVDELNKYRLASRQPSLSEDDDSFIFRLAEKFDLMPKVLCHRDLVIENILTDGNSLKLIDFEYAGFAPRAWEWGNFLLLQRWNSGLRSSNEDFYRLAVSVSHETGIEVLTLYEGAILASSLWLSWSVFKKSEENRKFYNGSLKFFINLLNSIKG